MRVALGLIAIAMSIVVYVTIQHRSVTAEDRGHLVGALKFAGPAALFVFGVYLIALDAM